MFSQVKARWSASYTPVSNVADVSKQRTTPNLIGLAGGPGAGKDIAGSLLVRYHGFRQYAFADALRDFVYAANDSWRMAFDLHGYEVAKHEVEGFRDELIKVGNAAREWIDPDVWIWAVDHRIAVDLHQEKYNFPAVITDVRYLNEAKYIRSNGGLVVGVDRPEHYPETEEAWEVFERADDYVMNHNTPSYLLGQLDSLIAGF